MSAEAWYLDAAVAAGLYGLLAGMLVPAVIARIPEPPAEPERPADEVGSGGDDVDRERRLQEPPEPPKPLYADIARGRGLRAGSALATAVVAALLGGRIGFAPELAIFLYLAPVGVALAVVDWRTRLLPTKIIAPSYLVVAVLAVAAAWSAGEWDPLVTAGFGWLVAGGTFFALWFVYPKGMGYGDVRLSGVLGIALGYLGWAELLTGVYAGFLVGGVAGLLLSLLRLVDRKAYAFGPFMLIGAVIGVVAGPYVAAWYV